MPKTTFELINDLFIALSHLLWPIIALICIFLFKEEMRSILQKLKRGSFFGTEIEIDKEIIKFEKTTAKATTEVPQFDAPETDDYEKGIIDLAKKDPKLALISLAMEMEKHVKKTIAQRGELINSNFGKLPQAFEFMDKEGWIPKHTMSAVAIFWDLRSRLVHGGEEESSKIIGVLDMGMTLLRTLKSIPYETKIVHHSDIDIYSDKECNQKRDDVKGIMINFKSSGGLKSHIGIYPTTKFGYYKKNKEISWEWNLKNKWEESWYKDPEDSTCKYAWTSSGEFIGRHLDEI